MTSVDKKPCAICKQMTILLRSCVICSEYFCYNCIKNDSMLCLCPAHHITKEDNPVFYSEHNYSTPKTLIEDAVDQEEEKVCKAASNTKNEEIVIQLNERYIIEENAKQKNSQLNEIQVEASLAPNLSDTEDTWEIVKDPEVKSDWEFVDMLHEEKDSTNLSLVPISDGEVTEASPQKNDKKEVEKFSKKENTPPQNIEKRVLKQKYVYRQKNGEHSKPAVLQVKAPENKSISRVLVGTGAIPKQSTSAGFANKPQAKSEKTTDNKEIVIFKGDKTVKFIKNAKN